MYKEELVVPHSGLFKGIWNKKITNLKAFGFLCLRVYLKSLTNCSTVEWKLRKVKTGRKSLMLHHFISS